MRHPILIITGWIICIPAVYYIDRWRKLRKKLKDITGTQTSLIGSLLRSSRSTGRIVEVKGKLVANSEVLKSYFTESDCVFFHAVEKDKVREVYKSKSSDLTNSSRIYYSISTDKKSEHTFYLEDSTGKILIDPEGAEVDGKVVLKSIEPTFGEENSSTFSSAFQPCGEKIIAVIKEEQILPLGEQAYVIGELFFGSNGPIIGSSPEKDKTFLISLKDEETLVKSGNSELYQAIVFSIVASVAGIALIIMGW